MTGQTAVQQDRIELAGLSEKVARVVEPYVREVARAGGASLLSASIVGSAVTPDYREGISDINNVLVLARIEPAFLDALSGMGRGHGKRGIAAPLLMTPEYIQRSLDTFPLEFLSFKRNHVTVYGADPFANLHIEKPDARRAVERELKGLLMNMRRGYVRCAGNRKRLKQVLLASINSIQPAFAGLLYISGAETPAGKAETVAAAAQCVGVAAAPFEEVLALRDSKSTPDFDSLRGTFGRLCDAVETASAKIDRA
jgi:hypothetical protein